MAMPSNLSGTETQLAIAIKVQEYQQQIAQINERILVLKSMHNAVTPIHAKLPSEILIHIFRHVEPNACQDIQLSHVCRMWRSAIHQAAEFWVDFLRSVPVNHNYDLFRDFFAWTSPLPFGISLKSNDLLLVRQLQKTHLLRVAFLSVTFRGDYRLGGDLLDLIHLKLPSLKHLSCRYETSKELVDAPAEQIRNARSSDNHPRLLILHIHGRCLTPAFLVASLRNLHIFGPINLSTDFMLNALRACPSLEELMIEDVFETPSQGAQAVMGLESPIPMERLGSLTLVSLPGDAFTRRFLPHLEYPPTTEIDIIGFGTLMSSYLCHSSPPTSTPATSTIQRVAFSIIPNHSEFLSKCEVKGSSNSSASRLSLILWYGPWDFPSDHDDHHHARRFLDFATVFSSSQAPMLTHVEFRMERGLSMSDEDWHTVLDACPQIRSLDVRIASCRGLLRTLRRHQLLPQLESLSITCENGSGVHESLVAAIESRAAMAVSHLDKLRFYTAWLARRKEVDAFPPFSESRLERLRVHARDVYIGAKDGTFRSGSTNNIPGP
uniref:Beta-glucosidase (EC) n=1 Tax=Ganoderma boninense TaxID=34458 RepID=A0A5K1K455_9APHY|nr:Beta-glucosidase (EC [Ganoderma boninense]